MKQKRTTVSDDVLVKWDKIIRSSRDKFKIKTLLTGEQRLGMRASINSIGIPLNCHSSHLLRVYAQELGLNVLRYNLAKPRAERSHFTPRSMPFGPVASMMTWTDLQQPAVYAIICEGSQRRYVGSSARPDLRRAVHLFYLRNYFRWSPSNRFFGNLEIAADVKKYGVESFYCEILRHMPGASEIDLVSAEKEELMATPDELIYNISHDGVKSGKRHAKFCTLDKTMKKLHEKSATLLENITLAAQALRDFTKNNPSNNIPYTEKKARSVQYRKFVNAKKDLAMAYNVNQRKILDREQHLRKFYNTVKKAPY